MAITANPVKYNAVVVGKGTNTAKNITAATVIKAVAGRVCVVSVIQAGSGAGGIYDLNTTSGSGVANAICVVPDTQGVFSVDMPCSTGILVVPGTGQTLAVSYS